MSLIVNAFFDVETFSFSYVLVDPDSRACAIGERHVDTRPYPGLRLLCI